MGPPRRTTTQMSSQFSSQNYGEEDQRFVELLKPIKDLTVNWSVPLAKYLQDYYEELTELQISLDGKNTQVNFAEAALFLQGTASVYSKKVEFLWQNVLKMLDLLSSKKALEEAENDPENEGFKKRSKKSTFDDSQFKLVSIELAKNTNLKGESKDSNVHSRKMTLKFIFVTPRQLIEKEGKEQKTTRVNMYLKSAGKYDLLGQKEEFRVNSQFALGTGMIGEELSGDSQLGQQSVSLCCDTRELSTSNLEQTLSVNRDSEGQALHNLENVIEDQEIVQDFMDNDHVDDLPDMDIPEEFPEPDPPEEERKKRTVAEELLNEPKPPLEDSWEPLEPHEVVTIPKPIRKGRRKRPQTSAPDVSKVQKTATKSRGSRGGSSSSSSNVDENRNSNLKVSVPIEDFLIKELKKGQNVSIVDSNLAEAIRDEAIAELKSRNKKGKDANENVKNLEQDDDRDQVLEDQNDIEGNDDNGGGWEDLQDDDLLPIPDLLDSPDTDQTHPNADQAEQNTYEELVMKRVADYVTQSQDYIQSTDLAKRVRIWHESLAPKLEAVEKRGDFDIHQYGSKILKNFPQDGRKTTVDFMQVAQGSTPEEVSRLFLSSLMLANAQNIDVQCSASKKDPLPMDQVSMTLLSTQRHHEHISDTIPLSQDELKRKKPKAKKKLDVIQETIDEGDEGDDPSTIKFLGVDLDQEHAEALEAFDAIALSRKGKVPSNPNGLISVKPSTSSQSATTSRKGSGRKRK